MGCSAVKTEGPRNSYKGPTENSQTSSGAHFHSIHRLK